MTAPPELNTRTGVLSLAEPTFAALLAHVTSEVGPSDTGEQLALLHSANALDDQGRPHPSLGAALDAITAPDLATAELSYKGKSMRGWIGHQHAALLRPEGDDGRCMLMSVAVSMVPEALARLVDLTPRPRPEPAMPIPYTNGALSGVIRHWRWSAARPSERGAAGEAAMEVVDTENGLWVLRLGEQGGLVAWPSTPTRVWRMIVRLILHPSR